MHCGNCGHDERVHNESTERCCAPECRCGQFENVFFVPRQAGMEGYEEQDNLVGIGGIFMLDPEDIEELMSRMGFIQRETGPFVPSKIPDTIKTSDLNLDDPEVRRWLAEKIRSKN